MFHMHFSHLLNTASATLNMSRINNLLCAQYRVFEHNYILFECYCSANKKRYCTTSSRLRNKLVAHEMLRNKPVPNNLLRNKPVAHKMLRNKPKQVVARGSNTVHTIIGSNGCVIRRLLREDQIPCAQAWVPIYA